MILSEPDAKRIFKNIKFSVMRNDWLRSNGENRVLAEISMTHDDLIRRFADQGGKCHWSGLPLCASYNYIKRHPFAISVERVDNKAGYSYENIRLVIRLFNLGRCSYQGDFHEIITTLKENLKNEG